MLLSCPHCGPRAEVEFTWGGPGHLVRPEPATASDAQWAGYLFMRDNPRGPHAERWCHTYGCGQWFHVLRDTAAHCVLRVYGIAEDAVDAR